MRWNNIGFPSRHRRWRQAKNVFHSGNDHITTEEAEVRYLKNWVALKDGFIYIGRRSPFVMVKVGRINNWLHLPHDASSSLPSVRATNQQYGEGEANGGADKQSAGYGSICYLSRFVVSDCDGAVWQTYPVLLKAPRYRSWAASRLVADRIGAFCLEFSGASTARRWNPPGSGSLSGKERPVLAYLALAFLLIKHQVERFMQDSSLRRWNQLKNAVENR